MTSAAGSISEELRSASSAALQRSAAGRKEDDPNKVTSVALPQFNPKSKKAKAARRVAPCGSAYRKFMATQMEGSAEWSASRKDSMLQTFRDALVSLYREDKKPDGTTVYISKSDPTIELSESQYGALLGTEELTADKISRQCRARPAPPRRKRKPVKDDSSVAVREVNQIARAGMEKTMADDAAEGLPTQQFVKKLYAPSPWKQILDEDLGVYILQGDPKVAGTSGGVCKPGGACDDEDHLCLQGRCVMAEREISYKARGGSVVTEFAVVKSVTPTTMEIITKKHPNGLKLKTEAIVDQKQHRTCPPRVRERVTVTLEDGTEVTLNNLADKRRRMKIRYLANGDYIPMCMGPSHGRWMLDTGLLDLLQERDRKYFPIRATPVSEDVFDQLVQNNMVLYDVANKKVPFVLVPSADGETYERVYHPTIDPKDVAQLYTTENLMSAFRKYLKKDDLTQDDVDTYVAGVVTELETPAPVTQME